MSIKLYTHTRKRAGIKEIKKKETTASEHEASLFCFMFRG